ncbi:hypothetical protein F5X96DRAFT_686314 [Biscogniauxia mediterranea]|nr:hypothetical protein F5X96DRAFT_686314 [Biscogniauxia mediterranea]
MSLRKFTVVAALALASVTSAANLEVAAQTPVLGQDTVHGCYGSLGSLTLDSKPDFNSQGKCVGICKAKEKNVAATYSNECYCGDVYPNSDDLLDDSKCTEPCPGFDTQACGGLNAWTVYNTGLKVSVGEDTSSSSSSSSSTSSTSTSTTSATATAGPVTETSDADSGSGSGTNTVGIVVGVVIAVLVIAGLAGGAFFWMRRKRNAEIEEEHRRNAAVNAFITGGKPGSSGGVSMADARMDPVMNRRMSDGSIADNQDYSRRILRVTNA